jgi:acetyl-CoA decarbonylase/synthase complex subunit gamma
MALSGLDIYKLLPKTNCRECGFATCLAFAMQLAKKAAGIEKCPYITSESRGILEAASQPPIKLIDIGSGEKAFQIGNESVMFRHEEKFHRPCAIGIILEDSLTDSQLKEKVGVINALSFERIGQKLEVNLIAVKQKESAKRFAEAVRVISANTGLGIVLMSEDLCGLKDALAVLKGRKPLIYRADKDNLEGMARLAKDYDAVLAVAGKELEELSGLTVKLAGLGVSSLVLETADESIPDKIWNLTQIRKLALKKNNRSLGYPSMAVVNKTDPFEEAQEAAGYIAKYAGIVLIKGSDSFEVLSLLTLRQNIYTDPQKPLQIEPKLYGIGAVNDKSPVLVTTNFSLSYYTVLGEVEASKIPSYIVSVDTEGMSVLTAWAAEKFTPQKIAESIAKMGVREAVSHKHLIIPGYVAMMSGELQDESGFEVIVGPKEAAGIPSFLKNL